MPLNIKLAKSAGFCFGVKRAVDIAFKKSAELDKIYSLGDIIHNKNVVTQLEKRNVESVDSVDEIPCGSNVIIRAHGVSEQVYCSLKSKHCNIIDATCPFVEKIHTIVHESYKSGHKIVIIGQANHPEIIGIRGWCANSLVFNDADELQEFTIKNNFCNDGAVVLVGQTTLNRKNWEESVNIIKKQCTNVKIFDTICSATDERQSEARLLAGRCDLMVIVGDKSSSNTKRLFEICENICKNTVCIEDFNQLKDMNLDFSLFGTVGITAGASTPVCIIKEVINYMSEQTKVETGESFEELLEQEQSFKTLNTGDRVTGIITHIGRVEIQVDLGVKQAGFIPVSELTDDPNYKVEENIKVNDEIEALVVRVNDQEGTIMLSRRRMDALKGWEELETAKENCAILSGVVVEENKGGVIASVKGVRVFIPASQTGLPKDAPLSGLLKKNVSFKITEINRQRRRVVGSVRLVMLEERRALSEKIWETIEVGSQYKGIVKSIASYGIFVDIGGADGMVHISELSWSRVKHPSEIVRVGDSVDVFVIALDRENKKISLGHKKQEENPWTLFQSSYSIDDVVSVKIMKFMPFGAFAEIIPGIDGLIHISQISDRRISKPDEVLEIGQVVDALITEIDLEKKKISLSIKALMTNASNAVDKMSDDEKKYIVESEEQ